MAVAPGVPFLGPVGAGLTVCQQNFTELVRLVNAQALGVPENLKGHVWHRLHSAPLILDDPQAGQLLVDDGGVTGLSRHHGNGLDGIGIRDPAGNTGHLPDLPAAGLQVVEHGHAADLGLGGPHLAALNVLDLHRHPIERVPGVTQLLDADGAVGGVPEGQGSGLVVLHIGVLGALLRKQVILGRDLLGDGVVALQSQGNDDRSIRPGGEGAYLAALGVVDGENGPLQRNFSPLLQFHDLQGGFVRVGLSAACIAAHRRQLHVPGIVQVADIILQIAVFVLFLANRVHGGILGHIRR